ncbi:MAG: two-component regulator propeller domain-containing protein [bacterium]
MQFRPQRLFPGSYFLILFFFILFTSTFVNLSAQQNNLRFQHISIEDGLSQSTVWSIVQDHRGFLWFATMDGLNKYDGYNFTVYRNDPADTNTISELNIREVFEDSGENLWVITLTGKIDRYDSYKDLFVHYSLNSFLTDDPRASRVISIAEDISGQLWIATTKGELFNYNRRKDQFVIHKIDFRKEVNIDAIHMQCLYYDKAGIMWIGTWEGLLEYDLNTKTVIRHINQLGNKYSLSGNIILDICGDKKGNMWIASADGGVSVLNPKLQTFKNYRHNPQNLNSLSSDRVNRIFIDTRSNIWVATIDEALDRYDESTDSFHHYRNNPSVPSSLGKGAVMSIYEDANNCLWFGTSGNGISRLDWRYQKFQHIVHDPANPGSLSPNNIIAMSMDSKGNLWIGTDGGGLNYRMAGSNDFKHFSKNSDLLGSNSITCILEDHNGKLWIGTDPGINYKAGLFIYSVEKNSFTPFTKISVNVGGITNIFEDRNGEFWIGTSSEGLFRYNPTTKKVTTYKSDPKDQSTFAGNFILSIYEDNKGNIWISSRLSGLNLFNRTTGKFTRYQNNPSDPTSISSNNVLDIYEDTKGFLWVSTWGGGLNRFDPGRKIFRHFTMKDGLPNNIVTSILPDKHGNLWLGTNHGLCRFNPKTNKWKVYDVSDGLQSDELIQAICSNDGTFYFSSSNGITVFHPDSIKDNNRISPVVITKFTVFDKPLLANPTVNIIKEITLSYSQNFFTFEFAALDFAAPDKNQYKYMLEGIDEGWVYAGSKHSASYTDIKPGEYIFRVKGSNSDGVWNEQETVISLIITPPFYETWWFRILAIIFLLGIGYAVYKYRVKKLLEVERTRLRIARDLHDDVSASITGIVYFANAVSNEMGEKSTPAISKLVGLIKESATEVQESMSDIIWSINPQNDKWEIILPKFRRFASDLCESKGIKYNIEIPGVISAKTLPMEKRRDFWLIFKEMVTNAVKHSGCSEISITILVNNDLLNMKIEDNGKGFDSNKSFAGNGLLNVKSRAKTLNSKLDLETSHGNGTKWELEIPL